MYAPIVVFCYNRKTHLERTLNALEQNTLAGETDLYIFSDGNRGDEDIESVKAVRDFLQEYTKRSQFQRVEIVESEKNKGLAASIIGGASRILSEYGKIIVVEDDLETSPDFLEYMNQALDYYEDNDKIWSVTGYTLPLKCLKGYKEDVYLSYRASSWGWGTWKNRWDTVDWDVKDFELLSKSKEMQKQFNRGGREMFQMLKDQQEGRNNSWAIRWCYSQSKQDKFTVHPKYCKVRNIGGDGSGENSLATNKYLTELDMTPVRLKNIDVNRRIVKQFRDYYRLTLKEIWILGIAKIKRDIRHLLFRKDRQV